MRYRNIYIIVIHNSYTMAIEVRTKKWGNSIGVVIPVKVLERLNIKPEEEIIIEIEKKNNVLKEMFGTLKTKKSTEQIIKAVRKDIESKWLK
jgi:antitoxin component of MazEF toxin-antitoxin module